MAEPGQWLKTLGQHRCKRVDIEMGEVEYDWLHKRSKRNNLTPEMMVRTWIIKHIAAEEMTGLCVVEPHKKAWRVTLIEPERAARVESTFTQEESQPADVESPAL